MAITRSKTKSGGCTTYAVTKPTKANSTKGIQKQTPKSATKKSTQKLEIPRKAVAEMISAVGAVHSKLNISVLAKTPSPVYGLEAFEDAHYALMNATVSLTRMLSEYYWKASSLKPVRAVKSFDFKGL